MSYFRNFNILHVDGIAGLSVGIILFIFHDWISITYNIPILIVFVFSAANVGYGIYASSLAFSQTRKVFSIALLAFANLLWGVVCLSVVLFYSKTLSLFGIVFICLEGVFVSALAFYEWHNKSNLKCLTKA